MLLTLKEAVQAYRDSKLHIELGGQGGRPYGNVGIVVHNTQEYFESNVNYAGWKEWGMEAEQ